MSKNLPNKDLDLFEMLMLSTMKFVSTRISNSTNSKHYSRKMVQILCDLPEFETFAEYKTFFEKELKIVEKLRMSRGLVTNERKYVQLAYTHAFDIFDSLERRFEKGGTGTTYCLGKKK